MTEKAALNPQKYAEEQSEDKTEKLQEFIKNDAKLTEIIGKIEGFQEKTKSLNKMLPELAEQLDELDPLITRLLELIVKRLEKKK